MSSYSIDILVNPQGAVSGSRTATRSLEQLDRTAEGLKSTLGSLGVAFGVGSLVSQLVSVQREFDKLNAGLVSATGSAEAAAAAFEAIQDFASATPYDLAQATEGFIKLVNLGLTPSERALTSYGDTAAAMGKSLNQMVEAVADAATGEFERLKEFGIKAKNNGDTIAFTFQGVTTSVKNNAAEIESYLIALGENKFAGTMAERMKTLDGAISNLSDTWDNLLLSVNQLGPNSTATQGVRALTDAMQSLTDSIKSGQLPAYISAFGTQFEATFDDLSFFVDALDEQLTSTLSGWGLSAKSSSDAMSQAFWEFPANIRALIQVATVELASFVDKAAEYGRSISDVLNPFSDDVIDWKGAMSERIAAIDNAKTTTIDGFLAQRDAAISTMDAEQKKADELRATYEKQRDARKAAAGGRLAQFAKGSRDPAASAASSATADQTKKNTDAVAKLQQQLTQAALSGRELAVEQAKLSLNEYASPQQVAQVQKLAAALFDAQQQAAATQQISQLKEQLDQTALSAREVAQRQAELSVGTYATPEQIQQVRDLAAAIYDVNEKQRLGSEVDQIRTASMSEQSQLIQQYYEQQATLRDAYHAGAIESEQEYQELSAQLNQSYQDKIAKQEAEAASARYSAASQLFDGLAGIAGTFAGEQSGIYKAMFAASKAFAVADAIVKIQQGIAGAAAMPFPANIPAIGSVIAATGSIVSTISGTNLNLADGGRVTGPGTGRSDSIPANLSNGEFVMPASATRRNYGVLEAMRSGATVGSGSPTVNVNNYTGARVTTSTNSRGEIEIAIEEWAANNLDDRVAGHLASPYSSSSSALSSGYAVNRSTNR